jgi:hypothetical protein
MYNNMAWLKGRRRDAWQAALMLNGIKRQYSDETQARNA